MSVYLGLYRQDHVCRYISVSGTLLNVNLLLYLLSTNSQANCTYIFLLNKTVDFEELDLYCFG